MHDIRRPGWWERNWKWCVPVLCLAVAGLILAGAFGFIAFVMGMVRSSDPYQHALQRARADPAVVAALGRPIEKGFLTSGDISSSAGGDGKAHLAIPLQGARSHATLYVDAEETAGVWHYSVIAVAVDDGRRIDLLDAGDR